MSEVPGRAIALRDEMLELLYWLEGEGFGGAATLAAIARFLDQPPEQAQATLSSLIEREEVVASGGEYRLTEAGRREGARRFAEEFSPLLAQGHGECNDPACECRTLGPAECHGRQNRS